MPPLLENAALQTSINDVPSIPLNTLLAFCAILFAGMQGTLCMESAEPCRLSYQKLKLLLGLEFLLVISVVVSESISFASVRGPLRNHLAWLQWLPSLLLVIGMIQLALDVLFTCVCASDSRVAWTPFSSLGYRKKKSRFEVNSRIWIELTPLLLSGSVSIALIGWRENWWMRARLVSSDVAVTAATKCNALSVGALVVCIVWAFLVSGILLCVLSILVLKGKLYKQWAGMFNPRKYWLRNPDKRLHCETIPKQTELFETLYNIQYGPVALEQLTVDEQKRSMETSPISLGNVIIGDSRSMFYDEYARFAQMIIIFAEHFTILPMQVCVLVGLVQIHTKMDAEAATTMKHSVDFVLALALVEFAIGFKSFLWGSTREGRLHENDKRIGDPLSLQ